MKPSVIVVGAGVVGCTVACELAKAGARVQVLETRSPGQGATRASAGILAPYIEGHGSQTLRALGKRSLDLYDGYVSQLRADTGEDIYYLRNGTFELAFTPEDIERLSSLSAALDQDGIESAWVAPDAFGSVEPQASAEALGGLLIPTHGFVAVTPLALSAARAATKLGARFKDGVGAIRIAPLPNRRIGVHTAHATWEADRVVLAAGSWSTEITVEGADRIPVKPIRGQLIQMRSEPGSIRRVMWGPNGYLVPWPDGTVLIGSTVEDVGFDENHTEEAVARLRAAAIELVPALAAGEITSIRTGLRPKGPDDVPMLGRSSVISGLIYATAHYRNGVLLTPLTVQLIRDLVFDLGTDPALKDLDPARWGIRL